VDQTSREIATRYDFKGSKVEISVQDFEITITVDEEMRRKAVIEILKMKLAKRKVSLKLLEFDDPKPIGGDMIRQVIRVKNGLKDEELKKMVKSVKGQKMKVQAQIQGEQLRVTGKKRDDLQGIIAHLKESFSELELQFSNFRD
ncbi:YajQ family cyclic di-GMP-binding protein, partial [bacterium]|nr:YajQ family cyclic di-GMP-binding protein [bacterium]